MREWSSPNSATLRKPSRRLETGRAAPATKVSVFLPSVNYAECRKPSEVKIRTFYASNALMETSSVNETMWWHGSACRSPGNVFEPDPKKSCCDVVSLVFIDRDLTAGKSGQLSLDPFCFCLPNALEICIGVRFQSWERNAASQSPGHSATCLNASSNYVPC